MARTKRGWKKWTEGARKFQANDIASCRGHGIFLATCQSAREREASRELVTLITDAIEYLYPAEPIDEEPAVAEEEHSVSVEEMIRREVEAAKGGPNKGGENNALAQKAVSIATDIKGIVIIKLMRKAFCPVQILSHIMRRIEKERAPLTRYVVRLIPLQTTFFPKEEDLAENIPYLLHRHLPGIELPHLKRRLENEGQQSGDDDDGNNDGDNGDDANANADTNENTEDKSNDEGDHAAAKKQRVDEAGTSVATAIPPDFEKIVYCIEYKGRCQDVLSREKVFAMFNQRLREYGSVDYINPKVTIVVEAFKNIGGMSWIDDPARFHDFNVRRFQDKFTASAADFTTTAVAAVTAPNNSTAAVAAATDEGCGKEATDEGCGKEATDEGCGKEATESS